MRNRGKSEVETYNNEGIVDYGYRQNFLEFPCKKHPTSSSTSSGGICAYCLTDRLYQLVCPQCGEQRLSSTCSCTELFSSINNPSNSSSSCDVGNVGRISFLLENDKFINDNNGDVSSSKPRNIEHRTSFSSNVDNNDFPTLRRSNSTCVGDMNYSTTTNIGRKESKEKFWKIGRLFRKKKDKTNHNNFSNITNNDQENSYECNGVLRSRSLSSFRGFYDTEDQSGNFPVSSSAARASSVSTGNFFVDSAKRSCFSESEARISNFDNYFDANGFPKNNNAYNNNNNNNNIFSLKETEFVTSSDDPAYIDLKLDDNDKVPSLGALRRSGLGMSTKEFSFRGNNYNNNGDDDSVLGNNEMFRNGSCRRSSVTERELRKCRKSHKVLRWFFRHNSSSRENDDDDLHHHGFN
ncbi:hypothetical protein RND81_07G047000 [Saponaria officinalis]|uniref:Uncharacterized protein n=1 Tax=Saponaria officinalis TaxID=3572 RepID=A0AAW1JME8_SAPOF